MKLLLAVSSARHIDPFLHQCGETLHPDRQPYQWRAKFLQHDITILETGFSNTATTHRTTHLLAGEKYHLALQMGFGRLLNDSAAEGDVLNVVNEKAGDEGMWSEEGWSDFFGLGLQSRDEFPMVRGGFINLTNAYMNVFLPFKKVIGVTVNHIHNIDLQDIYISKHKATIETTNGLGFVYACLAERQNFYRLCIAVKSVNLNLPNPLLINALNDTLTRTLNLL